MFSNRSRPNQSNKASPAQPTVLIVDFTIYPTKKKRGRQLNYSMHTGHADKEARVLNLPFLFLIARLPHYLAFWAAHGLKGR